MGVLSTCWPRQEVLVGDLDDAIFAADFGELVAGTARPVYQDPVTFFRNTHPAKPLKKIVATVFDRLGNADEPGTLIRLSTGFGGGKTHTLMALWHIAKGIADPNLGVALLPAAGRPAQVAVAAIDASKAGTPVFAVHGKAKTRSLWGEIAWQLGGAEGLAKLGEADDPEKQPTEAQLEGLLPEGPVLLLLDELVVYMGSLSTQGQGCLKAFLTKAASIATRRPQTVLVVTDPADQRAYASEAGQLGLQMAEFEAAAALDDIIGRKASDFDPIGDETAQVIVTRLFDRIDPEAPAAAAATYQDLYERVQADLPGALPIEALGADYCAKVERSYPFHPRLLVTATDRLGALQEFNKSRGTLRLFARIIRTVWQGDTDVSLITAGEVDWSSELIQGDLLHRLNRDNFKAAVNADINGHAAELDREWGTSAHTRVASALLLESLPMTDNSGLSGQELTLAVVRPAEAGNEPLEALDRLLGVCWHTYPMSGGGAQFRYEPNVIKQIEQRIADVPVEDGRSRVQTAVQAFFRGAAFKIVAWPSGPNQVSEAAELQLALCTTEERAKSVTAFEAADQPRRFRNAIVAVTASAPKYTDAIQRARRLIAAEQIVDKAKDKSTASRLVRDQMTALMPGLIRQFQLQALRAFDRIVLSSGEAYSMEETYLADESAILAGPKGQEAVLRFLNDKRLLYQASDALDVGRFVELLSGATPIGDGVYTGKAVHERLLAAPGLRLIGDVGVVRRSVQRAVADGRVALRLADGAAFQAGTKVIGVEGARRRADGTPDMFALDDKVQIAIGTSQAAADWTKVDEKPISDGKGTYDVNNPPPPPPPPGRTTDSWDATLDAADSKPLEKLSFIAATPADAKALAALAGPLGATSITVEVAVSGSLRGGGDARLSFRAAPLGNPLKPIDIAATLATACENPSFEVVMTLDFGAGRLTMRPLLDRARSSAPETVRVRATFSTQP